jgi:hypothetical protein
VRRKITQTDRVRYLRNAADFWFEVIHLQKGRLLPEDTSSDVARADLTFFIVAVHTLREVARMANQRLKSEGAKEALEKFDGRWPRLKELRDHEAHVLGPSQGDQSPLGINYFGPFVADLKPARPGSSVEYLADARYMDADINELYQSLCDLLVVED